MTLADTTINHSPCHTRHTPIPNPPPPPLHITQCHPTPPNIPPTIRNERGFFLPIWGGGACLAFSCPRGGADPDLSSPKYKIPSVCNVFLSTPLSPHTYPRHSQTTPHRPPTIPRPLKSTRHTLCHMGFTSRSEMGLGEKGGGRVAEIRRLFAVGTRSQSDHLQPLETIACSTGRCCCWGNGYGAADRRAGVSTGRASGLEDSQFSITPIFSPFKFGLIHIF